MFLEPLVKNSALFFGMSEEKLKQTLTQMRAHKKEYKKGECLCREGGEMPFFGLVLCGTVQAFTDDINGDRVLMTSVDEGGTFGESLCFLGVKEIPVCIYAATDCAVLWLSCEHLKSGADTELYNRFSSMLAQRALDMNDRIQVLSKLSVREKLMTLFSQYAHKSGSRTFSLPFDRESLASYIGANRSALSRELSNMQKEGIIEFYKNSFKIL